MSASESVKKTFQLKRFETDETQHKPDPKRNWGNPRTLKTINLRLFKNPFRPSQLAENTERILNEIVALTLKTHPTHNARLRGWQRTTELKKHTVNTELQFCTKAATRWQSLLSRLLGQLIDTDTFKTKERTFL